jgi:hypothetical protein
VLLLAPMLVRRTKSELAIMLVLLFARILGMET